jgi:hypothetical protein
VGGPADAAGRAACGNGEHRRQWRDLPRSRTTLIGDRTAAGKRRDKIPQVERALAGRWAAQHHFRLAQQGAHSEFVDESSDRVRTEMAERVRPFADALTRLAASPGGGRRPAELLSAAMGAAMRRCPFPTAAHRAGWAGMAPGNHESAGKRLRGRTRTASPWRRAGLGEAGPAASRTRSPALGARYQNPG